MGASALRADFRHFLGNHNFSTLITVVSRNPVSPPELTADTPVADVVGPVEVGLFHTLRNQLNLTILNGFYRRLNELIHLYEPLLLDHRLNGGLTTVMCTDIVAVILNAY